MEDDSIITETKNLNVRRYEEVWQNQRWQPGFGFGVPLVQSTHFTDFLGNEQFGSQGPPDLPLNPGWKWISEWEVDFHTPYGDCDNEGWMYGTTFERLLESIKKKRATGSCSATSVVRRRRWIRGMECVNQAIIQHQFTEIERLQETKIRLEKILHIKYIDVQQIVNFEKLRRRLFQQTASSNYRYLLESPQVLQNCTKKLQYLKKFLIEKVNADKEYAKRMEALRGLLTPMEIALNSQKASSSSAPHVLSTQPVDNFLGSSISTHSQDSSKDSFPLGLQDKSKQSDRSGNNAGLTAGLRQNESIINRSGRGLVAMVERGSKVISRQIGGFGDMLQENLIPAIDQLYSDLIKAKTESKVEIFETKERYLITEDIAAHHAAQVLFSFHKIRGITESELDKIDTILISLGCAVIPNEYSQQYKTIKLEEDTVAPQSQEKSEFQLFLDNSTTRSHDVLSNFSENESDTTSEMGGGGLSSRFTVHEGQLELRKQSIRDSERSQQISTNKSSSMITSNEDLWLCIQKYRQSVEAVKESYKDLSELASREKVKVDSLMNRIRLVFISTIQFFASVQSQVWTECAELLSMIGQDVLSSGELGLGGPEGSTRDGATQNSSETTPEPVSPTPNATTEAVTGSRDDEKSVTKKQRVKSRKSKKLYDTLSSIPPTPEGSTIAFHGIVRVASLEDLRRVHSSTAVNGGSLSSLNLNIGQSMSMGFGSFRDSLASAFGIENDDMRRRAATTSDVRHDNQGAEDKSQTVPWLAVRAIVTSDGLLHLFQYRMDFDEWMTKHLERGSEVVTIGQGLVLIKSLCLKDCEVGNVSIGGQSYEHSLEIRQLSTSSTTTSTLKALLTKPEGETIVLMLRDEDEYQRWRDLLCDTGPLLPLKEALGLDRDSYVKSTSSVTSEEDVEYGNEEEGGDEVVAHNTNANTTMGTSDVESAVVDGVHEEVGGKQEGSMSRGSPFISDVSTTPRKTSGQSIPPPSPSSQEVSTPLLQRAQAALHQAQSIAKRLSLGENVLSAPTEPVTVTSPTSNTTPNKRQSVGSSSDTESSSPPTQIRRGSGTSIFKSPTTNTSPTDPTVSSVNVNPGGRTKAFSPDKSKSSTRRVRSLGSIYSTEGMVQLQGGRSTSSLQAGPLLHWTSVATTKYPTPPQLIPKMKANYPLALKQSDSIQIYEKGLEEERQRQKQKVKETKEKLMSEVTPTNRKSLGGHFFPSNLEAVREEVENVGEDDTKDNTGVENVGEDDTKDNTGVENVGEDDTKDNTGDDDVDNDGGEVNIDIGKDDASHAKDFIRDDFSPIPVITDTDSSNNRSEERVNKGYENDDDSHHHNQIDENEEPPEGFTEAVQLTTENTIVVKQQVSTEEAQI